MQWLERESGGRAKFGIGSPSFPGSSQPRADMKLLMETQELWLPSFVCRDTLLSVIYSWVLVRKATHLLTSKLKSRLSQQANWIGTLEKIRFGRQVWKFIFGVSMIPASDLQCFSLGQMFCYHRCFSGSVEMQVARGLIDDSQSRRVGPSARKACICFIVYILVINEWRVKTRHFPHF